jgi:hypothetical protein
MSNPNPSPAMLPSAEEIQTQFNKHLEEGMCNISMLVLVTPV